MSTHEKYRLVIKGMKCRGCVESVKRALGAVVGVEVDSVAVGEAVIRVRRAGDTDLARQEIKRVGFEADVFPIFALQEVSRG